MCNQPSVFHVWVSSLCLKWTFIHVDLIPLELEGFGQDSKYRGKIQVNTALGKTGFSHLIPT